jgi:hypothetical protein
MRPALRLKTSWNDLVIASRHTYMRREADLLFAKFSSSNVTSAWFINLATALGTLYDFEDEVGLLIVSTCVILKREGARLFGNAD